MKQIRKKVEPAVSKCDGDIFLFLTRFISGPSSQLPINEMYNKDWRVVMLTYWDSMRRILRLLTILADFDPLLIDS